MASNYSSDPRNIAPVGSSVTPQNQGGPVPEVSQTLLSPDGLQSFNTPSTDGGSVSLSGPKRLPVGTRLSGARYTIERLVAQGGMGAVYRAIDTRFNRPCAVKEMLSEFHQDRERALALEWFKREATLLLDLNHPCIPRVRDFFDEGGRNYLVMDFIDGYTLAEKLELEGNVMGLNGARGITEPRARSWTRQICSVLAYLHRQDPPIIFRDLKPSNIMITKQDEIKLIDFGIARPFQSQTQATVILTLGYAPPEQLGGRPEPRSDLYALGATVHRLLTRHDPTNNKPSIFTFPPLRSLRPDLSVAFDQIIMRALMQDVEQRWPSADEMERVVLNLPPLSVIPPVLPSGASGAGLSPQRITATPNVIQSVPPPSGPTSKPPVLAMHTTTGPAGAYIVRAFAHLAANPPRLDAAFSEVMTAHNIEPNNSLVHKIFGQVFARRVPPDVDNSMKAYNKSLELYFDDAETHKLVGDVMLYLRPNYPEAIKAYSQSIRLSSNDFEVRERLGQCYERTNQLEAALREYQEAVRLVSSQPQVRAALPRLYFALGHVARRLNQLPVAEHAFVQVLFQNPADHQTRFLLCQVYEQEGKLEDAFRECGYVMAGPMANNGSVQQVYKRLKDRLGR
jgi:serine/threonine protein kinase